jgi:hypothetical protein
MSLVKCFFSMLEDKAILVKNIKNSLDRKLFEIKLFKDSPVLPKNKLQRARL